MNKLEYKQLAAIHDAIDRQRKKLAELLDLKDTQLDNDDGANFIKLQTEVENLNTAVSCISEGLQVLRSM